MPRFAQNPGTGEVVVFDRGQWRPATDADIRFAQRPGAAAALGALEGATGLVSLRSDAETKQALDLNAQTAQNVGLATTLAGGLARPVGAMAQRIIQRVGAQEGAQRTATGLATNQGFRRNPDDLLPDAMQGAGRIVRAGAETLPVTRLVTDALIRTPNQRNLNRLAGRAIGATDEEIMAAGGRLTDEVLAAADDRVGQMFETVADAITSNVDLQAAQQAAARANANGLITNSDLLRIVSAEQDNMGRALMSLRSDLQRGLRGTQDTQVRTNIQNRIDEIDRIIRDSLPEGADGDALRRLYGEARARWRASLSLEKGAALSGEGNVNAQSLNTALRGIYGRGFRRGNTPNNAPADVRNFLEGAREALTVTTGVPSSGTAERLFAGSLLGGALGVNL